MVYCGHLRFKLGLDTELTVTVALVRDLTSLMRRPLLASRQHRSEGVQTHQALRTGGKESAWNFHVQKLCAAPVDACRCACSHVVHPVTCSAF